MMRFKNDEEDKGNGYLIQYPLPISCPPLHDGENAGVILECKKDHLFVICTHIKKPFSSLILVEDDFSLIHTECRTGWLFSCCSLCLALYLLFQCLSTYKK